MEQHDVPMLHVARSESNLGYRLRRIRAESRVVAGLEAVDCNNAPRRIHQDFLPGVNIDRRAIRIYRPWLVDSRHFSCRCREDRELPP